MFTSRAEHRLSLRADNAADRLTPIADRLGLLSSTALGRHRHETFARRRRALDDLNAAIHAATCDGVPLSHRLRQPGFEVDDLRRTIGPRSWQPGVWATAHADRRYEAYVTRQQAEVRRAAEMERRRIPLDVDFHTLGGGVLRTEARQSLTRFRPATFGQAGRLEGVTPADLTLLAVLLGRPRTATTSDA
jgi:tRNA uridine 5-carboxymethylaminomethyl modification enzyme